MQEESGETVCSDISGVEAWLCPLCQQGQPDRASLSIHLTDLHNVLHNCVDKLLDIAIPKQRATRENEVADSQEPADAAALSPERLKQSEESSSHPCQFEDNSDTAQQPEDQVMEAESLAEQVMAGDAQPEAELQENQPAETKRQTTTANEETPDCEKSANKNGAAATNSQPFKCHACLETFCTKTALSVHYKAASHIQRMTVILNEPQTPAVLPRPYLSNKPYQCALCRVSYNHAITLESHMKSVLHQSRSRTAANGAAGTGSSGGGSNSVPSADAPQIATSTTCAVPGNPAVTASAGEQIQAVPAAPSLLSSPVASAQAVSAFLTLLTSGPSSLSHSVLPSLFAGSGAAAPQLAHPQAQMLMPLILNGLPTHAQQPPESQSGELLTQCVPLLGLSAAQQALLAQRLSSLQNQWPSVGVQAATQPPAKEEEEQQQQQLQCEQDCNEKVEKSGSDKTKVKESLAVDNIKRELDMREIKCETAVFDTDDNSGGTRREKATRRGSLSDQLNMEGGDKEAGLNLSPVTTEKSFRNNNLSPSASMPSNSSLSPLNMNLTLSPDSTPQKSQPSTSPCGSFSSSKTSPSKSALMTPDRTRPRYVTRGWHVSGPPILSEFQAEVLRAFLESRSEADAASPPREDCEALGREVGLAEDEVRRWLSQARHARERHRASGTQRNAARPTTHLESTDYEEEEDEESALIIAEGEEGADASGSQVMDLSSGRGKGKGPCAREGQEDSCLTSDSENEDVYTSVIVSEEESQNGSAREGPGSPGRDDAQQREAAGDKGSGGGKVLRSTTVFLSDAEDEYEEEEGGGGQRVNRKKRKGDFDREEVEVKKERPDPDVDLQLEAQGDPPSTLPHSLDPTVLPGSVFHSLPLSLSLSPFSAQFLSPYILSLPTSMVGESGKLQAFSNPPNITRFHESLLSQSLSPRGQNAHHYLSNGDDCESALDLSMGKHSNSRFASSSSSTSSSLLDKTSIQKGRLLDGLGLRPTSKGLVVVQVKPEPAGAPGFSSGLVSCGNMSKSSIYARAAEKMNAAMLERDRELKREPPEREQPPRKPKVRRFRDMRRSRTIIQAEQLDILYGCYFKDPNPGKHEFEQISEWVHLPKKVVQIWFQNMRARERKGEVRFISDGTLAAVGKPLIKFTWPLSKPIFSNKSPVTSNPGSVTSNPGSVTNNPGSVTNNPGSITTAPIVRTLIKTEKDVKKPAINKQTPVPIKPKVTSSAAVSPVSSTTSVVPKVKPEPPTTSVTMVKVAPKITPPILAVPPKDPIPIAPRPTPKRKLEDESEEEKTDDEQDEEEDMGLKPGSTNRMVPRVPTTPINNKLPATTVVPQKQNGLNYWTSKGTIKINTLSREQLALPAHTTPRTIPPPPTPSIAPVSPSTPSSGKVASPSTPATKTSPRESNFLSHSSSRRPRTHLSCLQLSILQSCYETCAHPNAMECESIGTELGLPLKVVQIWFQNTRAKEKRWRLQQEKMSPLSSGKTDMSSGSYLQYNAQRANRPILPKPVQLTVIEPAAPHVEGQPAPKETLTGRCEACNVCFESRAAARAHVFSPRHLATLRTTNFGQPTTLVNKNGTGSSGSSGLQASHSSPVTVSDSGSVAQTLFESPSSTTTSNS